MSSQVPERLMDTLKARYSNVVLDTKSSSDMPKFQVVDDEDFSEFEFSKFAAMNFQGEATHTHTLGALRQPLLQLSRESDQTAALAVWKVILRLMYDRPEPSCDQSMPQAKDSTSMMTKIYSTLGQNKDPKDAVHEEEVAGIFSKRSTWKKFVSLIKRSTIKEDVGSRPQQGCTEVFTVGGSAVLEEQPMSDLEKIHFIIGHGILLPELRDEIYCQICKQLTKKSSNSSHARGWRLLSLCVCCFPPSDKFRPYLFNFLRGGPTGFAPYCEDNLKRTLVNGARNQPPSWFELQSTKSKKPIILLITLMDNKCKSLLADSATTARELCQQLSEKINLKDTFGFSLHIAMFDKVCSLGSGGDHVMDAISQCEQYAKEQGGTERNAPWRLLFRKEVFAPWHDPSEDDLATHLIYQQIVRGIKFEEYKCEKDEDLAMIVAQQYYIEYSNDIDEQRIQSLLSHYIPDSYLKKEKYITIWMKAIISKLKSPYFQNPRIDPLKVKGDIVSYAKHKWPLLFSRFFETYKYYGPTLPTNDVIIAINCTGVYVVDEQEQVLLELPFPYITAVSSNRNFKMNCECFNLYTVKGNYTFTTPPKAEDIRDLVVTLSQEFKKGPKFCIATPDYLSTDSNC